MPVCLERRSRTPHEAIAHRRASASLLHYRICMTLDGAALLATLFPIGVLILAVNARDLKKLPLRKKGESKLRIKNRSSYFRTIYSYRNFLQTFIVLGTTWGLFGTVVCAWSVCIGEIVRPWTSTIVIPAAVFQGVAVFLVISRLVSEPSHTDA